jgi:hypothetical protein
MSYTSAMPNAAVIQQKKVLSIVDTGKTFTKKGEMQLRHKYLINFLDGYRAEYCPVAGNPLGFEADDMIFFKVAFRSNYGDEIELVTHQQSPGEIDMRSDLYVSPDTVKVNPVQYLAVGALQAAATLYTGILGEDNKPLVSETVELAEELLTWLRSKE